MDAEAPFSASSRAIQARRAPRLPPRAFRETITPDLAAFIAQQTGAFLATAGADGQPYVQHRGGPPGFLRVLEGNVIGFADFRGNRQYITLGNLAENPKAHLFLIDHAARRRVKLWGRARVVEDAALMEALRPVGYAGVPEQVILLTVEAWDMNCPQHIPQRLDATEVAAALAARDARIADLEAALAARGG